MPNAVPQLSRILGWIGRCKEWFPQWAEGIRFKWFLSVWEFSACFTDFGRMRRVQ